MAAERGGTGGAECLPRKKKGSKEKKKQSENVPSQREKDLNTVPRNENTANRPPCGKRKEREGRFLEGETSTTKKHVLRGEAIVSTNKSAYFRKEEKPRKRRKKNYYGRRRSECTEEQSSVRKGKKLRLGGENHNLGGNFTCNPPH